MSQKSHDFYSVVSVSQKKKNFPSIDHKIKPYKHFERHFYFISLFLYLSLSLFLALSSFLVNACQKKCPVIVFFSSRLETRMNLCIILDCIHFCSPLLFATIDITFIFFKYIMTDHIKLTHFIHCEITEEYLFARRKK